MILTPPTLTIRTLPVKTSQALHVPTVDFTSMNFANLPWTFNDITNHFDMSDHKPVEHQKFQMSYQGPHASVQKAVQGSLLSSAILPIPDPPASNATWDLQFYGPSLNCTILDNQIGLGKDILIKLVNKDMLLPYCAWVPDNSNNNESNLPFNNATGALGGSPLTLYTMVPPSTYFYSTGGQAKDILSFYQQASSTMECQLYNASYSVHFNYVAGEQHVDLNVSPPLNAISAISSWDSEAIVGADPNTGLFPYNPNLTAVTLNRTVVETLAFQSVMDAFASMFIGNIQGELKDVENNNGGVQYQTFTSMLSTPLAMARELSNLTHDMARSSDFLGNVVWDGKSVVQTNSSTRPMSELMEDMFHNATVSLISQPALK